MFSSLGKSDVGRKKRQRRLRVESLEDRRVLATTPVISEFVASNDTTLVDGDGNSSDWLEVHNPTFDPIDLTGWHLTDNVSDREKWTFPPTTLQPGEYRVIFASGQSNPNYVDSLGYQHTTFKLSAGGEYLALTDRHGQIIHDYSPEYPAQSTDISYGLDASDDQVYFSNPTPGAVNDYASANSINVMISEIMYHPASENVAEEFIEIYNGDSVAINLNGWEIRGGVEFDFPNVTIQPGGYVVVAADLDTFRDKYPTVFNVVGGWSGKLSNRTEALRLATAAGLQVDSVTYADQGHWAVRERGPDDFGHEGWQWSDAHDGLGSSLELVNPNLPNRFGQNWAASVIFEGTPGSANSVADMDGDSAPLILDTLHSPAIPSSTDNVVITTRLIDDSSSPVSASAAWRVDGEADFQMVNLVDDGTGADAIANNGIFSAEIPAQPDGSIVEWYIATSDATGNLRTYPAASQPSGLQETNLLYQVDDSFDPNAVVGQNDFAQYRLIMTEVERAELEQIGSNSFEGNSHAEMNGTFISVTDDGVEVRYNVGIRNRGRGSRSRLPNSYRVNLPSDNKWQGIDQFNLNTQFTYLQLIGMRSFEAAGIPAEDTQPVFVKVNGNDLSDPDRPSYGVYVQVEAHNSDFADNNFPEDANGNLYRVSREGGGAGGHLQDQGDELEPYLEFYEKKTNAGDNDWSDLLNLISVLNDTSDEEYFKEVSKVADIKEWLRYFAGVSILNSRETMLGTGVGDDYLLYSGTNDPRFVLMAHDFDTILGQGDTNGEPDDSLYRPLVLPPIERFLTHPEIAPLYHETYVEMLQTTFSKYEFDRLVHDLVGDFMPMEKIDEVIAFMDARRDFILAELSKPITADSGLPISGGYPSTTLPAVGLAGTVPLAGTRSVTVNGALADLNVFEGTYQIGSPVGLTEELITRPSTWEYLDAGRVPSTAMGSDWRIDDPGFSDSGPSPLGYGESPLGTTVEYIDTDPDTNGTQKNITTYFRKTFNVTNVGELVSLNVDLRRDDGAVIYLNGVEATRSNMPDGDIDDTTRADSTVSGGDEDRFYNIALDPSMLVEGENVIAVEIHQRSATSSDVIFDLELSGVRSLSAGGQGVPLNPGVNRLVIEAYDGLNGTGNLIDTGYYDVWYDDGNVTNVTSDITSDTTWTAVDGPFVIQSDLNVSAGTLTIEPGTSVMFGNGAGFAVTGDGRVVAEGAKYDRIRFSHNLFGGSQSWDGMTFQDVLTDNRFRYADFSSGDAQGNATYINRGRVLFDHVRWLDVNNQILDLIHPTLTVRNSYIPGIGGDETIHLVGLDPGEQLVFDNNVIGKNTSGGDVVDMAPDSLDRQPVYWLNNTFLGGFDDGVDTDGTISIFENNTFYDFHLNTSRTTTSNAISSGHQNVGGERLSSELKIYNNRFYDVDHALLLKDFGYAEFTNNTVVKATIGGIQFQELSGSNVIGPGLGATLDGNIFWETPLVFEALHPDTNLQVRRSIVTDDLVDSGFRNLSSDPLLIDPARGDFGLREGSPAFFKGPDDSDIGAEQRPRYQAATAETLRITELHYNPVKGKTVDPTCEIPADGDWFEFIELLNPTGETIDLTDVTFTDGIEFTFPWGATLGPGERSVLVKDRDIFESRYGTGLNIGGEYTAKFSNGGERIELRAADNSVIADFTYGDGDEPGWPALADGDGPSLEVIDINGDYNDPANWRAGVNPGGTPGQQMLGPFVATSDHHYETDDSIAITFNEPIDVATIADHTEFTLTNLSTGNTLSAEEYMLSGLTSTGATVSFATPTIAADGNWRIMMAAGAFSNSAGVPNVTAYEFDFFILKGDYNRNRIVDAADFTVWRDTLGSTNDLRANGDNSGSSEGIIDDADRLVWLANFGNAVDDTSGDSGSGDSGSGNGRLDGPARWGDAQQSDAPAPIRTLAVTPPVQTIRRNVDPPHRISKKHSAIQQVFENWE